MTIDFVTVWSLKGSLRVMDDWVHGRCLVTRVIKSGPLPSARKLINMSYIDPMETPRAPVFAYILTDIR